MAPLTLEFIQDVLTPKPKQEKLQRLTGPMLASADAEANPVTSTTVDTPDAELSGHSAAKVSASDKSRG